MTTPTSTSPRAAALAGEETRRRLALAERVARAHRGIDDASLLCVVSGSTVDDIADERSDVDMCIALAALPQEGVLRDACRRAGSEWTWHDGTRDEGWVVSLELDGIEIQIGYCSHAWLVDKVDELLVRHNPDTPYHKVGEGLLKSVPLAGAERLAALQRRLADFPPALGRAMVVHGLNAPVSWRGIAQLLHRDAAVWWREIQVDACYRLLLVLCGLDGRYFTRFHMKRLRRLAGMLHQAPPQLAERIDALLAAPGPQAFAALYELEGEVLDLVTAHAPDVDTSELRQRRAAWAPVSSGRHRAPGSAGQPK